MKKILYMPVLSLFILSFFFFKDKLLEDLHRWKKEKQLLEKGDLNLFVDLIVHYKEYRSVFYYRIPFCVRHLLMLFLPRMPLCMLTTPSIGEGLYIEHGFSSILSAKRIGKNFAFYQNVTVGWNHGGNPVIGDNVRIYAGAVVCGPILVGNNVIIGANSVVFHDVPDNCIVAGIPAQVIRYIK